MILTYYLNLLTNFIVIHVLEKATTFFQQKELPLRTVLLPDLLNFDNFKEIDFLIIDGEQIIHEHR